VPLDAAPEGELPPEATLAADGPGPEQELQASTIRHRLTQALKELPPDFREAVVLRDVEGMDYRTMARILGVRVGTVKSRIARGREALRLRLQDLLA
jgi:RNA polymerase sigma-70 factor (ECF subfamily)